MVCCCFCFVSFFVSFFFFWSCVPLLEDTRVAPPSLHPSLLPPLILSLPPSHRSLGCVCGIASPLLSVCVCVCVCVRACVRALLWPPPPPCASLSASAAELSQHASPLCSLSLSLCTCFSHYLHISAHHNLFLSFLLFFLRGGWC